MPIPVEPCPQGYGLQPALVPTPTPNPYAFGALAAFNVIDDPDDHHRAGTMYRNDLCGSQVLPWVDDCDPDEVLDKAPTDEDALSIVRGCPFHLLALLSCKETTIEALRERATTVFQLGEQRAIEDVVWANTIATADATVIGDDNPVNAVSIVRAVAALESAVAGCYPGVATLHADRGVGILAAADRLAERAGSTLVTPLNTKWALYADGLNTGPDGDPAPDGYAWVYATGEITLRRFPVDVRPDYQHTLVLGTNEPRVYVERTYVAEKPCCSFAILVNLSLGAGGDNGGGAPVEP
jgi:hypothetical protein